MTPTTAYASELERIGALLDRLDPGSDAPCTVDGCVHVGVHHPAKATWSPLPV